MNTWIFQGNPNDFQGLDEYLKKDEIVWSINQMHYINNKDIHIDDDVYMWKSEEKSDDRIGILAYGKIISLPEKMADDEPWRWTDPEERREAESDEKYKEEYEYYKNL